MKVLKVTTLVFALSFFFMLPVMAQLPPPPSGGGTGGPIDGGAVALVIGSALYGYKKLKAERAKEQE